MQPSLLNFLLPKSVKTTTATPNTVEFKVWEQKKRKFIRKDQDTGIIRLSVSDYVKNHSNTNLRSKTML